jgi:hypothetical protein
MPSSALVTQLFSSLMRVYRTFPPVAPTPKQEKAKVITKSESRAKNHKAFCSRKSSAK